MQRGPTLHFKCVSCTHPIYFTVLDSKLAAQPLTCSHCEKQYLFSENMIEQIKKFEALCLQIHLSEEILGNTSVAIDVGPHHVKVPFRLLLTRLGSVLDLTIADQKVEVVFRTEPLNDIEEISQTPSEMPTHCAKI